MYSYLTSDCTTIVLLPYARSVMQIWRNTLITPSWPLGVAPLIFSYHKKRSSYTNLVETILACDALYWLGHGRKYSRARPSQLQALTITITIVSLLQTSAAGISHHFIIVCNAILSLVLTRTVLWWSASPLARFLIGLLSFGFASFYWTPIILLVGFFL